jgi:hypothetical protein
MARRRLLGLLGLAGAAPLWIAGARAADPPPASGQPAPAAPAPAPQPGPPAAAGSAAAEAGPSDDARDLAAIARRRYGAHLDEAQLKDLTAELDDNLKAGERLRKVKLANADEPDFTFHATP